MRKRGPLLLIRRANGNNRSWTINTSSLVARAEARETKKPGQQTAPGGFMRCFFNRINSCLLQCDLLLSTNLLPSAFLKTTDGIFPSHSPPCRRQQLPLQRSARGSSNSLARNLIWGRRGGGVLKVFCGGSK